MGFICAKPLSRDEIRQHATQCRHYLNLGDYQIINAPKLLDVLSLLWGDYGFQYLVLPDESPRFGPREEATTDIATGMIYIKESVFKKACRRKYDRAAFTICHEIGHFVLHRMLGGVSLARSISNKKPKIFEDPEWQADTFASEFLMPAQAVKDMNSEEIRKTFGVSKKCAEVRYKKVRGEFAKEKVKKFLEQ